MPYQNRVKPNGEIFATEARGTLMGNRGILHDSAKQITKQYAHPNWVICVLEYKGRKRPIMSPNKYTELFFLDEATALAAGHRPCATCQRDKYKAFKTLFTQAHGTAVKMDNLLHRERLQWVKGKRTKQKKTFTAALNTLPDYVFITHNDEPYLLLDSTLHHWTPFGYDGLIKLPDDMAVSVLTPAPTVAILRLGYTPSIKLDT